MRKRKARKAANLSKFDKAIFLVIVDYILKGQEFPSFSDLTVITGKSLGRTLQRNSGPASTSIKRLSELSFLAKSSGKRDIKIFLTDVSKYPACFTAIEREKIGVAMIRQYQDVKSVRNSKKYSASSAPTLFSATVDSKPPLKRARHRDKQLQQRGASVQSLPRKTQARRRYIVDSDYLEYLDHLLLEARRNGCKDAHFQLALIFFEDWESLEELKPDIVFPSQCSAKPKNIVSGLKWLNDAARLRHRGVEGYMVHFFSVLIPGKAPMFTREKFTDLIECSGLEYLQRLMTRHDSNRDLIPPASLENQEAVLGDGPAFGRS